MKTFDVEKAKSFGYSDKEIQDFMAKRNLVPKFNLGDIARNAVKSTGELVGGMASSLFHPVKTISGIGKLGLGIAEKLIPGRQKQEKYADAMGQYLKKRYGGIDEMARTAYFDPAGAAMDASMVFGGTGGIARKLGEAGKIDTLANVGSKLSKVGEYTDPLRAIGEAAKLPSKPISKVVERLPEPEEFLTRGLGNPAQQRKMIVPMGKLIPKYNLYGRTPEEAERAIAIANKARRSAVDASGAYGKLQDLLKPIDEAINKVYNNPELFRNGYPLNDNAVAKLEALKKIRANIQARFAKTEEKVIKPKIVTDNPLIKEAKKYKSADEFVRSVGRELYHGSKTKFDRFDVSKFGAGEGGNKFGLGSYLTDSRDLADFYAKTVSKKDYIEKYVPKGIFGTDIPIFKKDAEKLAEKKKVINEFVIPKNVKFLDSDTFRVNNEIINEFAKDYMDRGFSKEEAINEIKKLINIARKNKDEINNFRGELEYLFNIITPSEGVKNRIIEKIKKLGYDGIKYASDKTYEGVGGYNYVVFDPNKIISKRILRDIYNQAHQQPLKIQYTNLNPEVDVAMVDRFRRTNLDLGKKDSTFAKALSQTPMKDQAYREARSVLKKAINEKAGVKELGEDIQSLIKAKEIFEGYQSRVKNRQPFNFTKLGSAGVGGIIGGLPGAIGGYFAEQFINSPMGTKFIYQVAKKIKSNPFSSYSKAIKIIEKSLSRYGIKDPSKYSRAIYNYMRVGRLLQ